MANSLGCGQSMNDAEAVVLDVDVAATPASGSTLLAYQSKMLRRDCDRVKKALGRSAVLSKVEALVLSMSSGALANEDVHRWAREHGLQATSSIQYMPLHLERDGELRTVTALSILPDHVPHVLGQGWLLEERYGQHFLTADQTKFEDKAVADHGAFIGNRCFSSFTKVLADHGLADKAYEILLFQDADLLLKYHKIQPELPGGVRNPDFEEGKPSTWTVSIKDEKPPEVLKVAVINNHAVPIPWNPSAPDVCIQPDEFTSREEWERARNFEFLNAHFTLAPTMDPELSKMAQTMSL